MSARVHDSLCALRDMPIEYFMDLARVFLADIYEATKVDTLIEPAESS